MDLLKQGPGPCHDGWECRYETDASTQHSQTSAETILGGFFNPDGYRFEPDARSSSSMTVRGRGRGFLSTDPEFSPGFHRPMDLRTAKDYSVGSISAGSLPSGKTTLGRYRKEEEEC